MRHAEAGMVLLEVLVALALFTMSGIALAGLVRAGLEAEGEARVRERTLATEERVLAAMTLLDRADLDRRLGRHPVGELLVDVERPEPTLYRLALADTLVPAVEALVTVVYRPESPDAF